MKGGKAIGAGSDGCVFNVQFDASGNVIAGSETGGSGIATKVYAANPGGAVNTQAANEYAVMMAVRKATNGRGVVTALDGSLRQIPDIAATERTSSLELNRGACAAIQTASSKPYTVLELPLVSGHIRGIPGFYFPESFNDLEVAVKHMRDAGLSQLDFAPRNVFFVTDEAGDDTLLLGDFGNGIIASDDATFVKGVQRYTRHYKAQPVQLSARDGIHYRAFLYAIALTFYTISEVNPNPKQKWEYLRNMFAGYKSVFRQTMGALSWRLLSMLEIFAPEQHEDSGDTSADIDAAYNALTVESPASAPVGGASSTSEEAGVVGGIAPVISDALFPDYSTYKALREEFIAKFANGIDETLDEILAIEFAPETRAMLIARTKDAVLASDTLMYEFLRAVFVDGPVPDRLTRLIAAWFPSASGSARRKTYRKKLRNKRVKMSRRR